MKKDVKLFISMIMSFVFVSVLLLGCSAKDDIVGTWQREDSTKTISFYEDGACKDLPIHTLTSADVVSYKVQDDGTLMCKMEWDGPINIERTEDKEKALDNWDYYYLSGNTLVLYKNIYIRK